jgi:hypothetical protein
VKPLLLSVRRPHFAPHFVRAMIASGLSVFATIGWADPRFPLPPVPENAVIYHESFDEFAPESSTNAALIAPGDGLLVQSWSFYALDRSAAPVLPYVMPGLNAAGGPNLASSSGAIRFWYLPYFSSAAVAGGTGPGAPAHLADWVASSRNGTAVV